MLPIQVKVSGEKQDFAIDEQGYVVFQPVSTEHPNVGEKTIDYSGSYYVIHPTGELTITNNNVVPSVMDCSFVYADLR